MRRAGHRTDCHAAIGFPWDIQHATPLSNSIRRYLHGIGLAPDAAHKALDSAVQFLECLLRVIGIAVHDTPTDMVFEHE